MLVLISVAPPRTAIHGLPMVTSTMGISRWKECKPIRREDLYSLMLRLPVPAVAAMDFPFGLPQEFLPHIGVTDNYKTIDEIWTILAYTDRQDLEDVAAEFVRDYSEPHRVVERHYPESSSTLHRVNPDMLPMTYLGARLLSRWVGPQRPSPMACVATGATLRTTRRSASPSWRRCQEPFSDRSGCPTGITKGKDLYPFRTGTASSTDWGPIPA